MAEVTVGEICKTCVFYAMKQCPYGNHKLTQTTMFRGDIRGKCNYYQEFEDMETSFLGAKSNKMHKKANEMKDSELNIAIYKKVMAMNEADKEKIINYWAYIFPPEYAKDIADDENKSTQKNKELGKRKKKTERVKDKGESAKKEKDESSTKNWFKNIKHTDNRSEKGKNKFNDDFMV